MRILFSQLSYIANELQQQLYSLGIFKDIKVILSSHLNINFPVGPYRRFISTENIKKMIAFGRSMLNSLELFLEIVLNHRSTYLSGNIFAKS
jgi:hypothetical protein